MTSWTNSQNNFQNITLKRHISKVNLEKQKGNILTSKSFHGLQRETHVGSCLFLWQMFSNIKMKYLVFCAKPVEDKFLASAMRQNSIHLQFFIIASVLLQNSLFLIKSSQIQHAYLCGTHIFERIKYPELTHKHVQQLVTLSVHPVEQNSLYIFFPHLQLSVEETPAFQIQRHPS